MTNQANQAFEDFYNENKHLYTDKSPYGIMLTTFQAATKASESEINSLKQRVEELEEEKKDLEDEVFFKNELISTKRKDVLEITDSFLQRVKQLQADNERLREAGQALVDRWDSPNWSDGTHTRDYIDALRKALSSTPAQSLAEHDNEVIQMCANEFNVDSNEYKTIQALKAEHD